MIDDRLNKERKVKVFVVFIQNKVYQEIGNVYTSLEEALEEVNRWQANMDACSFGYSGAVVIERELKQKLTTTVPT